MERAYSENLNAFLGEPMPILDRGFVRVVDYMGDDAAVVQAARVSYGKGTKSVSDDRGLIRYLMRNDHTSPFEMCEIKFHIKLPIFVARQWIRHRTANVNEHSARYSELDNEFYFPKKDRIQLQSTSNKQGRSDWIAGDKPCSEFQEMLENTVRTSWAGYTRSLTNNIARELGRIFLPTNVYTQMYWKIDLHNLLHFLRLRMDPHAQYEIRVYADLLAGVVKEWCPMVYEAFEDYQLHAFKLSRMQIEYLQNFFRDEDFDPEGAMDFGMSKREASELGNLLKPNP